MTDKSTLSWVSDTSAQADAQRALRIVVADDDRDSVLTLMLLLREEGHEVRGVYSSRQVMGHVIDFDPDVVLLDIAMPELSGWEVAPSERGAEQTGRFLKTQAPGFFNVFSPRAGDFARRVTPER